MTAIAIWHNNENPVNPILWVAADSWVSSQNAPLIEDAAKVLSLTSWRMPHSKAVQQVELRHAQPNLQYDCFCETLTSEMGSQRT